MWCALSLAAIVARGGAPCQLELEAKSFDGIPCYSNWHPAKGIGWYVKEHIHASGRAVAICDGYNVGAAMQKRLPAPVPAGTVRAFVRVYRMHGGTRNAIEVSLGTVEEGAFRAAAARSIET